MKSKFGKRIYSSRNADPVCILLIAVVLSGLFGCSKTEEYVVAVEDAQAVEDDVAIDEDDRTDEVVTTIYVDVCGAVKYPGVYQLDSGARVFEALELAGGLTDEASVQAINQAGFLTDGQKLYIPTEAEWDAGLTQDSIQNAANEQMPSESVDDGRININTADEAGLCELPGIGESRAQAIIQYREEHGDFKSIEEIQNVSGIKSGMFTKIKDLIKVQ